jgi:predicted amidohydrolase
MEGDFYRGFRAAAVQVAPVFLDREATIEKLEDWVAKAKAAGADLVVFGEFYIPAFPLWNMLYAPVDRTPSIGACSNTQSKSPGRMSNNWVTSPAVSG